MSWRSSQGDDLRDTDSDKLAKTDIGSSKPKGFPIIALGASAGGLEALKEFFTAMPTDSGMGFVVIQHLEPTHESRMAEILAKCTTMKVIQAQDGLAVEPNVVYTNAPGRPLGILKGKLTVDKTVKRAHVEAAIDHFFIALSQDQGPLASGIILSGSIGIDGPRGVRAIRAADGMCMAQDPGTAQFPAMPQAAIDTGLVDYVLPPGRMPAVLQEYLQHPQILAASRKEPPSEVAANEVEIILKLLRARTNSDYRHYKRTTVLRRIQRRMGLRQISSLGDYINMLRTDAIELSQLAKDMLIGVSSFFRDAETFEHLRTDAIVPLVAGRKDDTPLRAWVAGCATGEEAYSVAMLMIEARGDADKSFPIQVFATDVDDRALDAARAGAYPLDVADQVSPERLKRFFTRQGQTYQVNKHLRETVIFSRHNLLADPPFSKLDLVSCRNVLIYIEAAAQKKVFTMFSFALNVGGYLVLGKSEGVGEMEDLFESISKPNRIFRLTRANRRAVGEFPLYAVGQQALEPHRERTRTEAGDLRQINLDAVLRHFDASVVLIEPDGKILYFHGHTEKYLGHPKGPATLNILDMTGGTLSAKLRRAIDKALHQDEPVRLAKVPLPATGTPSANLTVMRVADRISGGMLVAILFEDARPAHVSAPAQVTIEDEPLVAQLEAEVKTLRTELRTNAEGYDAASEELKAANEEVMSMNEELQSANEELEASKEELQSVNEELTTVNSQLSEKVNELTETNSDLANLLKATDIATIFLDSQSRISRFTPRATELLNLIESDLGRPVGHITQNFTGIDLAADAQQVLKGLLPLEKEVRAGDGRWYTVRILPYRTLDDRIDGTVVTFSDVSRLKQTENDLRYEKTYAQSIVETVHNPLLVLDDELRMLSANQAFYRMFKVEAQDSIGQLIYDLGNHQWDTPVLRDVLQKVADNGQELNDFEVSHEFPVLGPRTMLLNARLIEGQGDVPHRILLAIEDITQRKRADAELHKLTQSLARSNEELEQFGYAISHDLQEPLRMITGFLDMLRSHIGQTLDEKSQDFIAQVTDGARRMQTMIKDLLDLSRVGREDDKRVMVDLAVPLDQAMQSLQAGSADSGAKITHDPLPTVSGVPVQLARLFQNLIGNAIKFRSDKPPKIHIWATRNETNWRISVEDNGIGIDNKAADRVFQVFQRLHTRDKYEGTGIGLAICKRIVQQHGGEIWLESEVGKGTTFHFTLPAAANE